MTASHCLRFFATTILAIGLITSTTDLASAQDGLDRTVLPIQSPRYKAITEVDARKARAPARFEIKAPKDAPNVVIVLIDDIGFGTTSSFGGAVRTSTFDRLSNNGLRFSQFHTTAHCSPTRMWAMPRLHFNGMRSAVTESGFINLRK